MPDCLYFFKMADRKETIKELEGIPFRPNLIDGPSYHRVKKHLAKLYFEEGEELLGIYNLTEAYAASTRIQMILHSDMKSSLGIFRTDQSNYKVVQQRIKKEYISFDNDSSEKGAQKLINKLREMPKEWTIIQVTQEFDAMSSVSKTWKPRPSRLHLTRLCCGPEVDERIPICVTIEHPRGTDENMPFVFDAVDEAIKKLQSTNKFGKLLRKMRDEASQQIKAATTEIVEGWLREWRCIFLGELENPSFKDSIHKSVRQFISSNNLSASSSHKLYTIANGCAHLSHDEIYNLVSQVVDDTDLMKDIARSIIKVKSELNTLMMARRHPVLLIIEESLDLFPWEMIAVLMRHPVSRIASVHYAYALFKEHEKYIVDGNRIINQSDLGFYIVNPAKDLREMEERVIKFLHKRVPVWKGICGEPPTPDQFASALQNNVMLYCGHGSGINYLQGKQLEDMKVVALPLLFGCSSAQLAHPGGIAQASGVVNNYLAAGSACIVGMLWVVTSEDTDAMTATLLNSWLPGTPIDLSDFRPAGGLECTSVEPELLRAIKSSKKVALYYANGAALIVRGIPIKIGN